MIVHAPPSKALMQSYWFYPECNSIQGLKNLTSCFFKLRCSYCNVFVWISCFCNIFLLYICHDEFKWKEYGKTIIIEFICILVLAVAFIFWIWHFFIVILIMFFLCSFFRLKMPVINWNSLKNPTSSVIFKITSMHQ